MCLKNFFTPVIGFFLVVALFFSILDISKVFYVPHCLAFDMNDDANHTFVNLHQWRRILSQGEWPMMNVYNNFGTPLLGDVITYPISPLSLTYAFLPGPIAQTLNRTLMGFLTLFLLFVFYYRRFPKGLSIGLGLCTFYAPGFLWHSAHHHFQMSLLLLTAFLLLQESFTRKMTGRVYGGMCAVSILMWISVSLNVVLILCILIAGYQFFLSDSVKEKNFWFVLSTLGVGLIAVFPDTIFFLQATTRSIRKLAEYPIAATDGANKIFITPIIAAGLYCLALYQEKKIKDMKQVFWLGFVPFAIVLFSRAVPMLWKQIPLLGATDVVRLTWGANIFLMMGCGALVLRWVQSTPGWRWQVFVCLLALGIDAYFMPWRQDWVVMGRLSLAVIWVIACICFFWGRRLIGFLSAAVVLCFLYYGFFAVLGFAFPQMAHVRGLAAFSVVGSEKYLLPQAAKLLPPNARVAYDYNSILGLDLRGANEGLFGSGARSTIMTNADFSIGLFNQGLVKFDNYTGDYHFCPPWRAKQLQALGVGYVVIGEKDETLLKAGWKLIDNERGYFVYQNPLPTGVVFFKDNEEISPIPFSVYGNGLDITLPLHRKVFQQLVISLLKIPGWRVWIDGSEGRFIDNENKFLEVSISPENKQVRLRYEPVSPILILACFLIALIIPLALMRYFKS